MDSQSNQYKDYEDKKSNSADICTPGYMESGEFQTDFSYLASYDHISENNQISNPLTSVTCPSPGFLEYFSDYTYPQSPSLNFLSSINFFSPESEIFRSRDNLIIFDWDDTLLPSTWLSLSKMNPGGPRNFSQEEEDALATMAVIARNTLQSASELGQVVIVTNAEEGWIELSCGRFFPTLLSILKEFKMISARSTYVGEPIFNPSLWKRQAFISVVKDFYNSRSSTTKPNIISIGDSLHERSALINCQKELNILKFQPKSIKLIEQPTICELIKEHKVLQTLFVNLVNYEGVLDLILFDLFDLTFYQTESDDQHSHTPITTNFNILAPPIDCLPN